MKIYLSAALTALAAAALSQDAGENHRYLSVFFGKSAILLGSSDIRYGGGFSYAYGKYEPRFSSRFASAQLVYEGYYDNTRSNGESGPPRDSDAIGGLAYMRWFPRISKTIPRPFLDFGWGFQFADRTTLDLPSEINSTPFADLGLAIPAGRQQVLVSLRYLHISNAGFVTPNRGQNQLFVGVTLSF